MKHNKDFRPVKHAGAIVGYIKKVWGGDRWMWKSFDSDKNQYYAIGSTGSRKKNVVDFVIRESEWPAPH